MGPGPSSRNLMAGGLGHAAHTGPHLNRHIPHIRTTTISPTHAKSGWNERSLPSVMTVLDIAHRAKSRYLSRSQGSITRSTHLTHRNVSDRPRPRPWQWSLSCRLLGGSAAHGRPPEPKPKGRGRARARGATANASGSRPTSHSSLATMGSTKKAPAKAAKAAAESRQQGKEWNYTHIPPSSDDRFNNGRPESRNLVTWTRKCSN